ncbi:MAG: hypothetical protein Tsb007_39640 [Rhizobacter sp.]
MNARSPHPIGLISSGTSKSHRVYRDRTARQHFGLGRDAEDRCAWLQQCRQWLLGANVLHPSEPAFLLGSLIVLDAIPKSPHIEAAWDALPDAYRHANEICLDWQSPGGGQNRRILSATTGLSWSAQLRRSSPLSAAIEVLVERLQQGPHPLLRYAPSATITSLFEEFLDSVRHALLTTLSGDLFAHVTGTELLTALPRSALARRRRQLALRREESGDTLADDADSTMQLMDVLRQPVRAGNAQFIERISATCRPDSGEPNPTAQRRRMLADLQALAASSSEAGYWGSLLLLWAVDLVRLGTRRTRPLSPHTISPYIQLTIVRLWRELRSRSPEELGPDDWQRMYEAILQDPEIEASQRGKAAAALTSFHEYAETLLDIPRLSRALDADVPVLAPRANIVWPHEASWILDRLEEAPQHDRLARQVEGALALLAGACLRVQDIWHIHMFGTQPCEDLVVVSIDPLPSAGTGKTLAARRQIEIREPRLCRLLRRWHERRMLEGALPRDLLFADPAEPRLPWRAGATEYLLNSWLKATTGDASIGTHALRHSHASLARAAMSDTDQRQWDQISASAGHEATRTTSVHYTHLFEAELRRQLDLSIHEIALTEDQLCRLSATRPGWIRKRWQRSGGDHVAIAWSALTEVSARVDVPDVATGYEFGPPSTPGLEVAASWTYSMVLACLCDWAEGRTPTQARLRQGVSAEQWRALETTAPSWSSGHARWPRDLASDEGKDELLPWRDSFARVRQPKWQSLLEALHTMKRAELQMVCAAWCSMLQGDYLSLAHTANAIPLLRWISTLGVLPSQLVVAHQTALSDEVLGGALDAIEVLFGAMPCVRAERPRRGRPHVYLMLRSAGDTQAAPSNAGLSIAGLHALMFAGWVWLELSGDTP